MHDSTVGRGALLCGLLAIVLIGAPLLPVSGAQAALPHAGTTTVLYQVPLRGSQAHTAKNHDDDDDDDICDRLHLRHDACKQLLRASRKCPAETRVITVTKLVPVERVVTVTKIVYVTLATATPYAPTPKPYVPTPTPTPVYNYPMF